MITDANKKVIALKMLKKFQNKDKLNKGELLDWFIKLSDKEGKYFANNATVKDVVTLATNIGIQIIN